mmetsp:Transcript_3560/g.9519  ORF Transcript_3560/g.9519 Transcript_3560/m.9519 type:complete len:130 (-) Transcript_3560:15-404(-)
MSLQEAERSNLGDGLAPAAPTPSPPATAAAGPAPVVVVGVGTGAEPDRHAGRGRGDRTELQRALLAGGGDPPRASARAVLPSSPSSPALAYEPSPSPLTSVAPATEEEQLAAVIALSLREKGRRIRGRR